MGFSAFAAQNVNTANNRDQTGISFETVMNGNGMQGSFGIMPPMDRQQDGQIQNGQRPGLPADARNGQKPEESDEMKMAREAVEAARKALEEALEDAGIEAEFGMHGHERIPQEGAGSAAGTGNAEKSEKPDHKPDRKPDSAPEIPESEAEGASDSTG